MVGYVHVQYLKDHKEKLKKGSLCLLCQGQYLDFNHSTQPNYIQDDDGSWKSDTSRVLKTKWNKQNHFLSHYLVISPDHRPVLH